MDSPYLESLSLDTVMINMLSSPNALKHALIPERTQTIMKSSAPFVQSCFFGSGHIWYETSAEGHVEPSGQHWLPAQITTLFGQFTGCPTLHVGPGDGVGLAVGFGVGAGGGGVGVGGDGFVQSSFLGPRHNW